MTQLAIPFEKLPDTHLRISFRHVAKNESKDKAEKTFSYTHMKIMKEDGSIIEDGLHELYVYKVRVSHTHTCIHNTPTLILSLTHTSQAVAHIHTLTQTHT